MGNFETSYDNGMLLPLDSLGDKTVGFYKLTSLKGDKAPPLVSIISSTFNLEKYVAHTIESLKRQTADRDLFEVLFVDDCSTDNTKEALEYLSRDMGNCFVLRTRENSGSAVAKNYGIRSSRGRYIMLLDGDDFLEPRAVEKTLEFMQNNPEIAYSYSRNNRVDKSGRRVLFTPKGRPFSREDLLHFNFVGAVECFNRRLFEKVGGFRKGVYVEDYDFALRASELIGEDKIANNPLVLYNQRLHDSNKGNNMGKVIASVKKILRESIKRKEGLEVVVNYNDKISRQIGHNFFEWREVS